MGIDIWDKAQDAVVERMESEGLKALKNTKRTKKMRSQFFFAEEFTFTDKISKRTVLIYNTSWLEKEQAARSVRRDFQPSSKGEVDRG